MKSRHDKPYDFDFLKRLGERIRHVRGFHRDLTQAQLATASHTTAAQICRIEYGVFYGLNVLSLKAIADALDTTVADLVDPHDSAFSDDVELQRLFARIQKLDAARHNEICAMIRAMLDSDRLEMQRVARKRRLIPLKTAQNQT